MDRSTIVVNLRLKVTWWTLGYAFSLSLSPSYTKGRGDDTTPNCVHRTACPSRQLQGSIRALRTFPFHLVSRRTTSRLLRSLFFTDDVHHPLFG